MPGRRGYDAGALVNADDGTGGGGGDDERGDEQVEAGGEEGTAVKPSSSPATAVVAINNEYRRSRKRCWAVPEVRRVGWAGLLNPARFAVGTTFVVVSVQVVPRGLEVLAWTTLAGWDYNQ